jgi:lipoprotein NlpI
MFGQQQSVKYIAATACFFAQRGFGGTRFDTMHQKVARMLSQVLKVLTYSLLVLSLGSLAMANGYDDAQAGIAELKNGDNAGAIRLLTHALDSGQMLNDDRATAYFDRGLAWANTGQYGQAITDYTDAIRFNPHLIDAFHSRGVAWVKQGEYDKAIGDFNTAIRFNPQNADTFDGRGVAWISKGENDKAIADFDDAIRLNPEDGIAFHYRGVARINKGECDNAIADFDDAIRLNPQDGIAFFYRGLAQFNLGRFGMAATDFAQKRQLSQDVSSIVLRYLSLSRSGASDSKAKLIADSNAIDEQTWPAPAIAMLLGKSSPAAVFEKAADASAKMREEQICEANFYSGEWRLLSRDRDQSRDFFNRAVRQCPKGSWAAISATAEVRRM